VAGLYNTATPEWPFFGGLSFTHERSAATNTSRLRNHTGSHRFTPIHTDQIRQIDLVGAGFFRAFQRDSSAIMSRRLR
jgi:hypothetical protein